MDQDFQLESYDYCLPRESIAQFPCNEPGASRLLVMPRHQGAAESLVDARFSRLAEFLPKNALLVANNSRVLPARIKGLRPNGGKAEMLLLTPLPLLLLNSRPLTEEERADKFARALPYPEPGWQSAEAECLLHPAGKIAREGFILFEQDLIGRVIHKGEFGKCRVQLLWRGSLEDIFTQGGAMPLPPYIKRPAQDMDLERYQTCYARKTGSVAAPTAGLHFTPQIRAELLEKGFEWRELTLYVGYGTFSPVRSADIREHKMHSEYVELGSETAEAIARARRDGRPVVAVGTTSLRALEGIFQREGRITPFSGWIDIFLYPGCEFRVVNGLITNFHLPRSSLIMLVSAFAGRERVIGAYNKALARGYRFFSYGDAMLIK